MRPVDVSDLIGTTVGELLDMLPTPPTSLAVHSQRSSGISRVSGLGISSSVSAQSLVSNGSDMDGESASHSGVSQTLHHSSNGPSPALVSSPRDPAAPAIPPRPNAVRRLPSTEPSSPLATPSPGAAPPTLRNVQSSSGSSTALGAEASEAEYFDLLCRTCRGVVHEQDRSRLYAYLLRLPADQLHIAQDTAHQALSDNSSVVLPGKQLVKSLLSLKSNKLVLAQTNKHLLDFGVGDRVVPVDEPVSDYLQLSSRKGKEKIKFSFHLPQKDSRWALQIEPMSGVVEKEPIFFQKKAAKPTNEDIKITLTCKTTVQVSAVIRMEIEGGPDHFFTINLQSENCLFGVPPNSLPAAQDNGYNVPVVLQTLRNYFVNNGGPDTVGIFRGSGEEDQILAIKRALNHNSFSGTSDINAIATVIKIWFRDLPQQLLNELDHATILKCEKKEQCIEALQLVTEPQRTLLMWLLDLLADVASHERTNQMNAQKLAICIAPNLFSTPPEVVLPPQEYLRLSQAVVTFVQHLLTHRIERK